MKTFFLSTCFLLIAQLSVARPGAIRAGLHSFTIQWISFGDAKPGTVTITPVGKGQYSIRGRQQNKSGNEYVTINGTFAEKGRELHFNGTIISQIASVNGGAPCERTGPQVFKASGARKYWRLQQMLNCDGEITDYIDVFF